MDTEDQSVYMSYPSPASDTTETTLPTPSLPSASSSRRPTILSPSDFNDNQMMSPIDPNGEDMDKVRVSHEGKVTPGGKEGGLIPSISVEMDETPTRPRRSGRSPSGGAGGGGAGLNIRGLTLPTAGKITTEDDNTRRDESEERSDSLGDLLPSPRVNAFKAALLQPSPVIPMSPAWQSFDASGSPSASPARRSTSPRTGSGPTGHPSSPSMMFAPSGSAPSPLGPRGNERRFDPTPQHGLHARNLSLFFPSPGQQHQHHQADSSRDPFVQGAEGFREEEKVLPAGEEKKVFGGKGGWSFGGGQNESAGADGQSLSPEQAKSSKRRGHHHKHSLSHNFFSFLDPTVTNPSLASSSLSPSHNHHPSLSTPASKSFPTNVPIPMQSSNSLMASSPTLSPLSRRFLDNRAQLYLSFAVIEFLIGAGLWVEGQLSGWRCLAAVGYLSVFDAAGVAIRMIRDGNDWRSTRRPYGTARLMTLLYFAQSLFLVFASVYIAKESIETILLGEGAHSHDGGGGQSHGHGGEHEHEHSEGHTEERSLPLLLLLFSSVTALFSGSLLGNHSKLVESVGTLFMPSVLVSARIPDKLKVLRNPFTMTVAGGSAAILIGSIILPSSSMHILDSALSLLLTVATGALAYPSARSFALVLLQTAPPSTSVQMSALRQSLRSIPDDRRILGIGSTRVWMIASTGSDSSDPKQDPKHKRSDVGDTSLSHSVPSSPSARSFARRKNSTASVLTGAKDAGNTRLSVSVVVHVNDNVGDGDVLDVTKYVWNRVSAAVGEGEVSVAIKRGWEGMETS